MATCLIYPQKGSYNYMSCKCAQCQNNTSFEMPKDIIDAAKGGSLAIFCGAGVSTEKKTVLPYSFYTTIKEELKIDDSTISFSDLMQTFCAQPNGRRKLLNKIKQRFDYIHSFPELENQATTFHIELSELYFINTIITTNWDTYFEDFCNATPIVTPEDFVFWNTDKRHVLKIHGSISNLGSIIATKDDYNKCLDNLNKGIIGSTLKTILANNTVVFIGFSFGDEDFDQIMTYLQAELNDFSPHIFIISLDPNMNSHIAYKNTTCITTDGTFFLHQLKLLLQNEKLITNTNSKPLIEFSHRTLQDYHQKVSQLPLIKYPNNIFCLAYQDGILHAFERFIQLYNSGVYNNPTYLPRIARAYEDLRVKCFENENYWDSSYYEGYQNGIILIEACEDDPSILKYFPYFYLPNATNVLDSYEAYITNLKNTSNLSDKFNDFAYKIAKDKENLVVHHPPY